MTWQEASQLVKDVLFHNSNNLYRLGLRLDSESVMTRRESYIESSDLDLLEAFLEENPASTFLRVCWNDFTATPRMRAVPLKHVIHRLREQGYFALSIPKIALGLLQNDCPVPGASPAGEYKLHPDFSSLQSGPIDGHISCFGEFREQDGSNVPLCPSSLLQRTVDLAGMRGLTFQVGFEIEFVLLGRDKSKPMPSGPSTFNMIDHDGHAWSVSRMMEHPLVAKVIEPAVATLADQGIFVEQVHPESAPGQFEISLPPAPPLEAVGKLLHVREVISSFATRAGSKMTLHPLPFVNFCGNAAHAHISIDSVGGDKPETYQPFYAGILRHLEAVCAFTHSNDASYARLRDGFWAGGRWIAWGTQNRETPLRKIEGSHWEVKCLDGMANPYLALSALLAAGMLGLQEGEKLVWGDCEVDPATLTDNDKRELNVEKMLPASLEESLAALREDTGLVRMLGEELAERYVTVKEEEKKMLDAMDEEDRRQWILARY